jgi:hypothetical protein
MQFRMTAIFPGERDLCVLGTDAFGKFIPRCLSWDPRQTHFEQHIGSEETTPGKPVAVLGDVSGQVELAAAWRLLRRAAKQLQLVVAPRLIQCAGVVAQRVGAARQIQSAPNCQRPRPLYWRGVPRPPYQAISTSSLTRGQASRPFSSISGRYLGLNCAASAVR